MNKTKLFELFIKHTNEKKVIVKKIKKIIKLNKSITFLDCGCGTGEITIPLSKLVKKTIATDKDNSILKKISKKNNIKFIKSKIENLNLKEKFDFALMAYIWYGIKPKDKPRAIKKVLNYLKPKGKLILITYGGSGCKIKEIFGPRIGYTSTGGIKQVREAINKLNLKSKNYKFTTKITADNINQMFKIYSNFWGDKTDNYLKLEKEIKEYLKKFKKNNKVITTTSGYILVINKK